MAMNPVNKNAQRVANTAARRDFQAKRGDLRDAFKDLKRSGDLSGKEIPIAAAKFKSDVAALQQKAAAATPNSRFFGTNPGALRNVPDEFSETNPRPANFSQLKQQRLIGQERDALRAPGAAPIAQPPAPISQPPGPGMKKGGKIGASKMGNVKTAKPKMNSASKRADGVAQRGKTKGRMV